MKKSLLFITALSFAVAGMAQMVKPIHSSQVEKLPMLQRQATLAEKAPTKKAPKKTKSQGLYYTTPEGTYFGGWDPVTGSGFYNTSLIIPPYQELTFTNKAKDIKGAQWLINGQNAADYVVENNFVFDGMSRCYDFNLYYVPTLKLDGNEYTLGETNYIAKRGYITSDWQNAFLRTDSLTGLFPADPRAAIEYDGQWYGPGQYWGVLDTDNLFGSGKYTYQQTGQVFTSVGTIQYFNKPASPLFITDIYVNALAPVGSDPIPADKQLRIVLTKLKEVTDEEGTFLTYDLDNPIATLFCNASDTISFVETKENISTRNKKEIKDGTLIFSVPGELDEVGNVTPQNIVIDEPFCMLLMGMDQEGVNCGLYGNEMLDEEENCANARILFDSGDGGFVSMGYQGSMTLDFCFYGMFDKAVSVEQFPMYKFEDESLDYNIIRVPAEGSKDEYGYGNLTEGSKASPFLTDDETANGYPGAAILTNVYWFDDENELLNYDVIDLPEWIEAYYVDPSLYDNSGLNIVMFKAQPLPEGVKGRKATVYVVGQEVTMNGETKYSAKSEAITILQGDASADSDNIIMTSNTKSSNTATYNMAGQQTKNGFKGIVVRDGKKFFNK